MKRASRFVVASSWQLMLGDMQIDPAAVLAHAGLQADLFHRGDAALSPAEYFRFWHGIERAAGTREVGLLLAEHFKAEGFQDILAATRTELADHYLKQSKLSLGEISFLPGFQEPNSFIRAYQGWKGVSPSAFRMQVH